MCEREFGLHPEVTWGCTAGVCSIEACGLNTENVNGDFNDGCECSIITNPTNCATGTPIAVSTGHPAASPIQIQGTLFNVGEENFFDVTFAATTPPAAWSPRVEFKAGTAAGFLLDVKPTCADATASCTAGFTAGSTAWSRNYTYTTAPYTDNLARVTNFKVRVYLDAAVAATCADHTYTLNLINP
jgi:hypothetical protein